MTRRQRTVHLILWLVLTPVVGVIVVGSLLARQEVVLEQPATSPAATAAAGGARP